MKIEKVTYNKYKLLRINTIKSKVYKKKHYLKNITLEDIEYRLKKALFIIYSYHLNNKRILFVGNPLNINLKIQKILGKTKHLFIPKDTWVKGIITNQNSSLKSIFKKSDENNGKISKIILQLKKKSDLVVVMDKDVDVDALKESYTSRTPVISLNNYLSQFDLKSSYKVPGNFILQKNNLTNSLFYSLLVSTLNRSNRIKQKFPKTQHKLNTTNIFKKRSKRRYKR